MHRCAVIWSTRRDAPRRHFFCKMENPVPTWLSREARVGVKWNCTRGVEVVEDDMARPVVGRAPGRESRVV